MATTPNFGWVTPAPTDFVTDLPADFETFADAVDADVQLIKNNADAALPETLIDAAGDLIYGTAADTAARLAIGTAGQVLTVNGGATAPIWSDPAGGEPLQATPINQDVYVRAALQSQAGSNISQTEDTTYFSLVYLPNCTLDRIACQTGSTGGAGNVTRLGIYNNSATNTPGTLLLDAGTVDNDTTDAFYSITINQPVDAGFYWLAINTQTKVATLRGISTTLYNIYSLFTTTLVNTAASFPYFTETGITGAFANAASVNLNTSGTCPAVYVRIT